jgi:hypothetical protein
MISEGSLGRDRSRNAVRGAVENDKEGITLGRDLSSLVRAPHVPQYSVMIVQNGIPVRP